jgi:DNA-binding transcriptional LysR family regulator
MARQLRLRQPSDIVRAPMIHVVSFPLAWPMWLRQAGVSAAKVKQAIWVDSFESALQLAENGAGVALGLAPLFAERERLGTAGCAANSQRTVERDSSQGGAVSFVARSGRRMLQG